jgi:hypothetical protein
MGKQVEMFPPIGQGDADDRLNRQQAELRLERMARDASKVRRPTHRRSFATRCPSCGACVTIPLP